LYDSEEAMQEAYDLEFVKLSQSNIPTSGSKLCACFLSATVVNYEVAQHQGSENNEDNSS